MDFSSDDLSEWNGNEQFLTREVLTGMTQKAGSEISRKRSFSRNTRFTVDREKELPHTTQEFLKKIGIDDAPSSDGQFPSSHSQQKSKLVGHVFVCLSALEQMVALEQVSLSNRAAVFVLVLSLYCPCFVPIWSLYPPNVVPI